MMMIFNLKISTIIILMLLLTSIYAAPNDIFKNNMSVIIKNEAVPVDGFFFSTGHALAKTSSVMSQKIAQQKAHHNALLGFYRLLLPPLDANSEYDKRLQKKIRNEYLKASSLKLNIQGITTVYELKDGKKYISVLACPIGTNALLQKRFTWKKIINQLSTMAISPASIVGKDLYLEICDKSKISSAQQLLANSLGKKYGQSLKLMMIGKQATYFEPEIAWNIKSVEIKSLSTEDLLSILASVPYHPRVCWKIGERLKQQGLIKNAQIFFALGSVCQALSPDYYEKCMNAKKQFEFSIPQTEIATILTEESYEGLCTKSKFDNKALNSIKIALGQIPAGSLNPPNDENYKNAQEIFFSKDFDVHNAYILYQKSIEKNLSANGCNMAGNCAMLLERPEEAILLLLQAVRISPKHKYAWIHLATAFIDIKKTELAKYCIKKSQGCKPDDWGKKEIERLQNTIK